MRWVIITPISKNIKIGPQENDIKSGRINATKENITRIAVKLSNTGNRVFLSLDLKYAGYTKIPNIPTNTNQLICFRRTFLGLIDIVNIKLPITIISVIIKDHIDPKYWRIST